MQPPKKFPRSRNVTSEEVDEYVHEYVELQYPLTIIADRYGRTPETVRRNLRKRDVTMRPSHALGLSSDDAQIMVDMYNKGNSITEICRQMHTAHTTVLKAIKMIGAKHRERKIATDLDIDLFVHHYVEDGWTLARIGAEYGFAPTTVGSRLRKRGTKMRASGGDMKSDRRKS
jgi:hypothetical protein